MKNQNRTHGNREVGRKTEKQNMIKAEVLGITGSLALGLRLSETTQTSKPTTHINTSPNQNSTSSQPAAELGQCQAWGVNMSSEGLCFSI